MDVLEFGSPSAKIVLVQAVGAHELDKIEGEANAIAQNSEKEFRLIAPLVKDWNKELSPWESPAVFGKDNFGDGAADTLKRILGLCADPSKTYYIGGYSLSGLFALWSVHQTDVFSGVAAASPSLWFPGFLDYMKENMIRTDRVYLSLGNKEEKTKNPVMATVGDGIREAYRLLQEKNIACTLEWNEGNHFKDPDLRMIKAFSRLLTEQDG